MNVPQLMCDYVQKIINCSVSRFATLLHMVRKVSSSVVNL
jgi:hypothetical protein